MWSHTGMSRFNTQTKPGNTQDFWYAIAYLRNGKYALVFTIFFSANNWVTTDSLVLRQWVIRGKWNLAFHKVFVDWPSLGWFCILGRSISLKLCGASSWMSILCWSLRTLVELKWNKTEYASGWSERNVGLNKFTHWRYVPIVFFSIHEIKIEY
jgi:hypothetical protein